MSNDNARVQPTEPEGMEPIRVYRLDGSNETHTLPVLRPRIGVLTIGQRIYAFDPGRGRYIETSALMVSPAGEVFGGKFPTENDPRQEIVARFAVTPPPMGMGKAAKLPTEDELRLAQQKAREDAARIRPAETAEDALREVRRAPASSLDPTTGDHHPSGVAALGHSTDPAKAPDQDDEPEQTLDARAHAGDGDGAQAEAGASTKKGARKK